MRLAARSAPQNATTERFEACAMISPSGGNSALFPFPPGGNFPRGPCEPAFYADVHPQNFPRNHWAKTRGGNCPPNAEIVWFAVILVARRTLERQLRLSPSKATSVSISCCFRYNLTLMFHKYSVSVTDPIYGTAYARLGATNGMRLSV